MTEEQTKQTKQRLSTVSGLYDIEGKGYLNDAQMEMRRMDSQGVGYLSNQKVTKIVEECMRVQKSNNTLKLWVCGLVGAVVILALSNFGTAFVAVKLAQETSVDSSSGRMMVKDSNVPVTTVSTGTAFNFTPEAERDSSGLLNSCISPERAGSMWNMTMEGSQSNLVLMLPSTDTASENVPSEIGLSLDMSGAFFNETHACIPVKDKLGLFCIDFVADGCHLKNGDSDSRRHLMTGVEGHHYRRELFQAARGRRLQGFISVQDLVKNLIATALSDVLTTIFVPSHGHLKWIEPISGGFRVPVVRDGEEWDRTYETFTFDRLCTAHSICWDGTWRGYWIRSTWFFDGAACDLYGICRCAAGNQGPPDVPDGGSWHGSHYCYY